MMVVPGMPKTLAALVEQLSALPGIGAKSAVRIALSLLARPAADVQALSSLLADLHQQVVFCPQCGCFAETAHCAMCLHPQRDHALVCVVEQAADVLVLERGHGFGGVYHVLHGRLSPVDGVSAEDLQLTGLDQRIAKGEINELILATSATVDGEASAHFIARRYADYDIHISRIARGVPEGGELEYLDQHTLSRAMKQRVQW